MLTSQIPVLSKVEISEDGSTIMFPPSSAILGLCGRKILLVEQYRKAANRNTYELPGGKIKSGESPLEAVLRELAEETGYTAIETSLIFSLDMDFSASQHVVHVYFGKLSERHKSQGNNLVHLLDIEEALRLVNEGVISHAPTVAALYWLKSRREK